jgi:MFS family permease
LSRRTSFWLVAALLATMLAAASAPSPLYPTYQALWGFSSVTLTLVYAVYAFAALAGLLVAGRVSDFTGRRPVVAAALLVQIAGMSAFVAATSVEWLFAARVLQGLATGVASGALSAWLLDLEPADSRRLGSVIGGLAPIAGLALGALGSGLLVQYAPDPLHLVYWLLIAVYVAALVAIISMPDLVARRQGWVGSLRPRVAVAAPARRAFATMTPVLVAVWAVAGLYLALGPALTISLLGTKDRVLGALVIAVLLGAGTLSASLVRRKAPEAIVVPGSLVLMLGVGLTVGAVASGSGVGLYLGTLIAGLGFGPAFTGAFRSIAALAPPNARAALLAALYVVIYLSFSLPAIAAGIAVSLVGVRPTLYGYGAVVIVLAGATTVALGRQTRSAAT